MALEQSNYRFKEICLKWNGVWLVPVLLYNKVGLRCSVGDAEVCLK